MAVAAAAAPAAAGSGRAPPIQKKPCRMCYRLLFVMVLVRRCGGNRSSLLILTGVRWGNEGLVTVDGGC